MVMLGALIAKTHILRQASVDNLFASASDPRKREALKANREMIRKGSEIVEHT